MEMKLQQEMNFFLKWVQKACLVHHKEYKTFFYKNISLFFIVTKGLNGCKRETERDGLSLLSLTPHWRHIFILYHIVIDLYSEPHLVLLWQGWSGPLLNMRLLALRASAQGRFYSDSLLLQICRPNLLSLYNIFNGHTFPSSSQCTWFISAVPLFILRQKCDILFKNLQLTCCQRSIYNTIYVYQYICISNYTYFNCPSSSKTGQISSLGDIKSNWIGTSGRKLSVEAALTDVLPLEVLQDKKEVISCLQK